MASVKQRIYWKAPSFVKDWMAWWSAWQFDRQRHGRDYHRVLEQIFRRDRWSAEQFRQYQDEQLVELVRRAARHVPHYRRSLGEAGVEAERFGGLEDLPRLPILDKGVVRSDPMSLVDERLDRRRLIEAHTSGTTGTPLILYRDVWLNSAAFAYVDGRCRDASTRRCRMRRRQNASVTIGGILVAAPNRTKPPFWVHNRRWRHLYMSSYHLSPRYLGHYVERMRRFGGEFIEGYPSSLYAVARHILDNNLPTVPFRAAFTTAETLFEHMREAIAKAFTCRVYDQYGAVEMCVLAAECERGSMHLSPDYGIVEVLDESNRPLPPGRDGQLVCTSLVNRVQPFIRYPLGDTGSLAPGGCACGSALPVLGELLGRTDSVLITRDGRRIGRLSPVFKGADNIAEAQVVQDDFDSFRIRVVPGPGYSDSDGRAIVAALAQRVGRADIRVELVDRIERTAAGKFEAVVCNLPPQKR